MVTGKLLNCINLYSICNKIYFNKKVFYSNFRDKLSIDTKNINKQRNNIYVNKGTNKNIWLYLVLV